MNSSGPSAARQFSVRQVDVSPVVVPLFDEVDEPERVVRAGDRSAVLGLDGDVVADPVLAQPLAGRERAASQSFGGASRASRRRC
jgi:hypothetical protein